MHQEQHTDWFSDCFVDKLLFSVNSQILEGIPIFLVADHDKQFTINIKHNQALMTFWVKSNQAAHKFN